MFPLGRFYYALCATRFGHFLARGLAKSLRCARILPEGYPPTDALALDHKSLKGLLELWPRIHWSPGDGMMPAEQLLAIYGLAATWPVRGDVVELGSWTGLTTCYLATACRVRGEGKVFAVDTFTGTMEGGATYPSAERFGGNTFKAFKDQILRAGADDVVEPLIGLTSEVAATYPGRRIRFLLIDADHSYEGVRGDFELWSPHVAPGGLIVFHDYLMPEVARYVDGHVKPDSRFDIHPGHVVPNVMAVTKRVSEPRTVSPSAVDVLPKPLERSTELDEVRVR
jgi:predicted O-methyltransferase YrrM